MVYLLGNKWSGPGAYGEEKKGESSSGTWEAGSEDAGQMGSWVILAEILLRLFPQPQKWPFPTVGDSLRELGWGSRSLISECSTLRFRYKEVIRWPSEWT